MLEPSGSLALKAQFLARSMEQAALAAAVEWGNLNPLLHPVAVWDRPAVFDGDILCALANLQQEQTPLPAGATVASLAISCQVFETSFFMVCG